MKSAAYSPDGRMLATVGRDNRLLVWSVEGGVLLADLIASQDWVNKVDWASNGKHIVTASWDYTLAVWDAQVCVVLSSSAQARTRDH